MDRSRSTDALEFPLLKNPQKSGLRFRRNLSDFIEEDGPSLGQFKPAQTPLQRPRKGSFLVTEQFRADESRRYRRAIHAHKSLSGASRFLVDRASDEFFSRPGFTGKEHRGVRRRDLGDARKHLFQGSGRADDLLEHGRFVDFFTQGDVLFLNPLFRPLAIFDIGRRCIAPDDVALVIAQWVGTNQEPAVLAVLAS